MLSPHFLFVCLCFSVLLTAVSSGRAIKEERIFKDIERNVSVYVVTTHGKFVGKFYRGHNSRFYLSHADIPYAKPPIGKLRFKKPEPLDPTNETFDATKSIEYESIVTRCKQYVRWGGDDFTKDRIIGTENCLYLDIIKPVPLELEDVTYSWAGSETYVIGTAPLAPVLVFLHPGTFMYDIPMNHYRLAENMCCNYIVFVFVRFRLGPLGFSNVGYHHGRAGLTPNLGLWDQVAALKWVQQHIGAWGGDSSQVTFAGVAAGAASVNYHLIAGASKGLFSKAISIGGSALCTWAFARHSVENTRKMIRELNCHGKDQEFPYDNSSVCLKASPVNDIMLASSKLYYFQNIPVNPLGPTIDDEFIFTEPELAMRVNHTHDVPWMVSFSSDYTLYPNYDFINVIHPEGESDMFYDLAPWFLGLKGRVDEAIMDEVTSDIREYYLSNDTGFWSTKTPQEVRELKERGEPIVGHDDPQHQWSTLDKINRMVSDGMHTIGIVEAARLHAWSLQSRQRSVDGKEGGNKTVPRVYLYKSNYTLDRTSDFLVTSKQQWGLVHREEFSVLTGSGTETNKTSNETQVTGKWLRKSLLTAWVSFIKYGYVWDAPELANFRELVKWPHALQNSLGLEVNYQILTDAPENQFSVRSDNIGDSRFWRTVPLQIYEEFDDFDVFQDDDIYPYDTLWNISPIQKKQKDPLSPFKIPHSQSTDDDT